jgi:hypothetical protein
MEEYFEKRRQTEKKNVNLALIRYQCLNQRYNMILSLLDTQRSSVMRDYVRKVVHRFPEDVPKIHEYIRKAGYVTDEDCWRVLESAFLRTKETAYLYEGLSKSNTSKGTSK